MPGEPAGGGARPEGRGSRRIRLDLARREGCRRAEVGGVGRADGGVGGGRAGEGDCGGGVAARQHGGVVP
ncbi:hypothetical protein BRADI_1g54461v3 [Brachypodium distachyon]|uniref:Uncharacterized protein n=1 Tax=Brachypodium distachyon TaxID=15368 RepID=A0A0Q3HD13_BRADI|nr:hypothetical protein BRADI_1g54461v3 [Brachypodium distachyon]